jgi:hypothetical protein
MPESGGTTTQSGILFQSAIPPLSPSRVAGLSAFPAKVRSSTPEHTAHEIARFTHVPEEAIR